MMKFALLSILLMFTKGSNSQFVDCEFAQSLRHDNHQMLLSFTNRNINIDLRKEKYLDFVFTDSVIRSNLTAGKIIVTPKDAKAYTISFKGMDIIFKAPDDSININNDFGNTTNINTEKEFSSTIKVGKTSFIDILYRNKRAVEFDILEADRKTNFHITYINGKAEIEKIKVSWLSSGDFLLLVYSGNNPFLIDYFNSLKNTGFVLNFKFRTNKIADALIYKSPERTSSKDDLSSERNTVSKNINIIAHLKYSNDNILRKKYRKYLMCE